MGLSSILASSYRQLLAVAFCSLLAFPVFTEPSRCSDPLFNIDTADKGMARQLCTMATEIRGHLESCGLKQTRALTIEITGDVSHPLGNCLAYFDCEYDLVRISEPSTWDMLMEQDEAYASLPTDVTLKALLTHELAHAFLTQVAGEREVSMVDQEYVAAAMELELMEETWRDVLLDLAAVESPPKEGLIDIWIYGFVPRKFAVNAWLHFRLPENGCALVQKIAHGDVSFAKSVRPELR